MRQKLLPMVFLLFALFSPLSKANIPTATFAGGNFWYMQRALDRTWGVMDSEVGYAGGVTLYPTYESVATGTTKHVEAVQLVYNPQLISYEKLLDIYFENIDPLDKEGQFCHRGSQYAPRIFYHSEAQKKAAEKKLREVNSRFRDEDVVVLILPYIVFYPAEQGLQRYYKRRPFFYAFMEFRCGRRKGLEKIWGTAY